MAARRLHLDDSDYLFSQSACDKRRSKVPARGANRDVLQQALQESISSRDYLQQKVRLFQDALNAETKRSERIEHENDKLVRENAKLREELSASFAELQETLSQKTHLEARNIELSKQLARASPDLQRSGDTAELLASVRYPEEAEVFRYLSFVVDTVDTVPDLRVLYQGRVRGSELHDALSSGRWALAALRLLQVLSDFIVYYADKHRDVVAVRQSQHTQTTVDKSVDAATQHKHSPSVSSSALDSGAKTIFRLRQAEPEGALSPRFRSNDDYSRLYEEHKTLLSNLNSQSDRLSKLNTQLSATMNSSRRLLATQAKSFLSTSGSHAKESEPVVEPPAPELHPEPDKVVDLTPEPAPAEPVKARSPPVRKSKFPIYRAKPSAPRRTAAVRPDRDVRVYPALKEEGWSSVSEFFNSAKKEESDSDAET